MIWLGASNSGSFTRLHQGVAKDSFLTKQSSSNPIHVKIVRFEVFTWLLVWDNKSLPHSSFHLWRAYFFQNKCFERKRYRQTQRERDRNKNTPCMIVLEISNQIENIVTVSPVTSVNRSLNIFKIATLPKLIYRLNTMAIKISVRFPVHIDQLFLHENALDLKYPR